MNKMIKAFVAPLLFLASFNVIAETIADPNEKMIKETIATYMKENHIPGVAVELYVDGKPYSYYFGYANQRKKTPINKDTIFEVGSISKVMTSLLLAQQVDFSRMQLNDSVKKFIPNLPNTFDNVTLQSLATHTSGTAFRLPENIKTQEELDNYLPRLSLTYTPNQKWAYSNIGIGLLGNAIEHIAYRDVNELYRLQILKPLGMQPIGTVVPKELKMNYAQGYADGKTVSSEFGVFPSAGAVKASANDMQRFLSAAIGLPGTPEKVFYPMRMTETAYVKLANRSQGLGWQIYPLTESSVETLLDSNENILAPLPVKEVVEKPTFDGNALIDKTGATDGFRAYIAFIPNKKSGIVILANQRAMDNAIVNVGREILFKVTKLHKDE